MNEVILVNLFEKSAGLSGYNMAYISQLLGYNSTNFSDNYIKI